MKQVIHTTSYIFALPWNAFVGGFLYYALLAILALGGLSPSAAVVATAYLAPAIAYLVNVAARLVHVATAGLHLTGARHAATL